MPLIQTNDGEFHHVFFLFETFPFALEIVRKKIRLCFIMCDINKISNLEE